MGIMNITPDSFYDGGKYQTMSHIIDHVGRMLEEGASIIDIGAVSTRPGASLVPAREELSRLLPVLKTLAREFPDAIWSVDTYNGETAKAACHEGAHMINDISAGSFDPEMFGTIAGLQVPYVIMHIKGQPANMQDKPAYEDILLELISYFSEKIERLRSLGVHDIIIDPGFGFGKSVEHNYELLRQLGFLQVFELPVMVGLSRKSMINRVLNTSPEQALNGTTVLNTLALTKGVSILRVHDVKQAMEAIKIVMAYNNSVVG